MATVERKPRAKAAKPARKARKGALTGAMRGVKLIDITAVKDWRDKAVALLKPLDVVPIGGNVATKTAFMSLCDNLDLLRAWVQLCKELFLDGNKDWRLAEVQAPIKSALITEIKNRFYRVELNDLFPKPDKISAIFSSAFYDSVDFGVIADFILDEVQTRLYIDLIQRYRDYYQVFGIIDDNGDFIPPDLYEPNFQDWLFKDYLADKSILERLEKKSTDWYQSIGAAVKAFRDLGLGCGDVEE